MSRKIVLMLLAVTLGTAELNRSASSSNMTPEKACETYYMMRSLGMRMQYIAQMHMLVPKSQEERDMYRMAIRRCPRVFEPSY